jgi:hypothetical protein
MTKKNRTRSYRFDKDTIEIQERIHKDVNKLTGKEFYYSAIARALYKVCLIDPTHYKKVLKKVVKYLKESA